MIDERLAELEDVVAALVAVARALPDPEAVTTGDWTAPQVLESRATSPGTWQGTVRNTAAGRAQAKIFAVCVRETTSPNGHNHSLIYSAPITVANSVLAGRREATLACGPGQIAIPPGVTTSAPADPEYREPEGNACTCALDL